MRYLDDAIDSERSIWRTRCWMNAAETKPFGRFVRASSAISGDAVEASGDAVEAGMRL
jgi:hypothetical protein